MNRKREKKKNPREELKARESCPLRSKGNLLSSLSHVGEGSRLVKGQGWCPTLLTANSLKTSWQEEAGGRVFARHGFLRKAVPQILGFLEVM